jgi:hypothetical protein
MQKEARFRSVGLFLLASLVVFLAVGQFPLVHAVSPVTQSATVINCGTACSAAFASASVTKGDLVVLHIGALMSVCPSAPGASVSDTLGSHWLYLGLICTKPSGATVYVENIIAYSIAPSNAAPNADTITASLSGTVYTSSSGFEADEVTGTDNYPLSVSSIYYYCSDCNPTLVQTGSQSVTGNEFAWSALTTGDPESDTIVPESGLTQIQTFYPGNSFMANSWTNNANSGGTTNFGWSYSLNQPANAALFGVVFGVYPGFQVIVQVVACTAFQLQCWLYPLFVFGIYMIITTGVARIAKVPFRDYTGHLLEGFSIAALLCVVLGILNIMPALIITVIQVLRAVRE